MSKYYFNENYFDNINNSHKAYWIGFIWADGYVSHRIRGNKDEYCLKISLQESDFGHLQKFVKDIDGNIDVKFYKIDGYKENIESRICIYKKYLPQTLMNKYGIIPNRTDCSKVLSAIPKEYTKDFIRGLLDADGSFTIYQCMCNDGYVHNKAHVTFGANGALLTYIENALVENKIVEKSSRTQFKRHEGADGQWRQLRFSGIKQTYNILHWLYDGSDIYLDRKFNKFYNDIILGGDNHAI